MKNEKKEFKKELEPILKLLNAKDDESKILGYGMFKHTKFRKYMRNKEYRGIKDKAFEKFHFYSLNHIKYKDPGKEEWKIYSNLRKINKLSFIIRLYLHDKLDIK